MANVYWIDGSFVPEAEARLPVNDLALLRGYGCFDFMRTYGGRVIFLQDHIRRLRRSAGRLGIELPLGDEDLARLVEETLRRNPPGEASVRLVVTGGPSPDFITPQGKPRLIVMVQPLATYPASWYEEGAAVVTVGYERAIPEAKTLDYARAILALAEARRQGAIEALYVDSRRRVREGTTSNVFCFLGDRLVTPGEGILEGITRSKVLELARGRHRVEIRDLPRDELARAEEVFITSSNRLIVPIVRVDADRIGSGRPGPRTRALMEAFAALTRTLARGETP
ncbi:MAG: aminotransferase class IV [Desulfobacterales bacterium]